MLIRVQQEIRNNPQLLGWIDDIEAGYMGTFGVLGASLAHVVLEEEWDFALVFPGSEESVAFLSAEITGRAPGQVEILTLRGIDLDDFRAARQAGA